MKNTALAISGACAALLLFGAAFGQDGDGPNVVIVEIFGCNYNDGADMSDLLAVAEN